MDYCEDRSYVSIHGKDIRVLICEKTGRILIPIDELKSVGFSIYRKSQYDKLLVDHHQFVQEFNLYMLQCAQNYMLRNQIAFKENEILQSINNCKQLLTKGYKEPQHESSSSSQFLQNHVIEQNVNEDITITSNMHTITEQNLNLLNKHTSCESISSESSRKSKNFSTEENGTSAFDTKNPRTSFDRKNLNQNSSFEQKQLRNVKQNVTSPLSKSSKSDNEKENQFKRPERPSFNQKNHSKQENDPQEEPRRVFTISLNKSEHNVLITHLESTNIAWVQDVDNANVLEEIARKIEKELKTARSVTRCEYNNVYLAEDEGEWYRCKPIKFKPLTIWFLEYGNSKQLSESDLREVSPDLAKIPAQAVRIAFEDSHYEPVLYDIISIKVVGKRERGTYIVKKLNKIAEKSDEVKQTLKMKTELPVELQPVSKNDAEVPTKVKPLFKKEIKEPPKMELAPKPKVVTFFNKPGSPGTLQDAQRVMIIGEIGGKLVVRTKECYDKLKEIEQMLDGFTPEPLPDRPRKNQLVLVSKDRKLYRGEIVALDDSSAKVVTLDYHGDITVNLTALSNITETLSREPLTYLVTPRLKNYNDIPEVKKFIEELSDKNTKATVLLTGEEFDLKIGDSLLSEKLQSLDSAGDRVMLKDLQTYKPPLGLRKCLIYTFRQSDNVTLVPEEEVGKYVNQIIKTDLQDDEPYIPIVGEVCFGEYQGSWSRCLIMRSMNGRFEVQFIDFGNLEFLRPEQLRKLTDDVMDAPILGIRCRLVGLPKVEDEILKSIIGEGEEFQVLFKAFNGDTYDVELPDVYNIISESNN